MPPGPDRSWISCSGPRGENAAPLNPASRQNARSYTATVFTIPPIHTGVLAASWARSSGSGGSTSIDDTASAGGKANSTWRATTVSSSVTTASPSLCPWSTIRRTTDPVRTTAGSSRWHSASVSAALPPVIRSDGPAPMAWAGTRCTPSGAS